MRDNLTLPTMIERAARWYPEHEALVEGAERCTYAELHSKIQRMAGLYHEVGVRKGDRVALLSYSSVNHCVAVFGALTIGAVPVALHVRESDAVLEGIARRASPRVLVYDDSFVEQAEHLRQRVPGVSVCIRARGRDNEDRKSALAGGPVIPDALDSNSLAVPPVSIRESDPAVIVFSSGTSGAPKGVVHTHRSLSESARGGMCLWEARPTDVAVNAFATSFIGWLNATLPLLNVAGKLVLQRGFDPKVYLSAVRVEHVTIASLVPTMWRMLLKENLEGFDFSDVRLACFAGEAMDEATLARIRDEITPHVVNVYGATETGSLGAGTVMYDEDMVKPGKLSSVGKPMPNADVRVITPGGGPEDELPIGESGELILRGPSVASEIWGDPEMTRRVFRGGWWYSGDNGHVDEDGFVFLDGRLDDMIISGGINVNPGHVEAVLLGHPSVADVAVVGLPDGTWGQQVAAFVVTSDAGATHEALDAFARESELSNYQRPRRYVMVASLPRTATGKLSRRLVREQATVAS